MADRQNGARLMAVGGGVAVVAGWFLLPFAWRKRRERRLAEACQAHGLLVLTYDDGPAPAAMTARLIGVLAAYGAHASFFMIGQAASERPDIVRTILSSGHEVGSHTQHHSNAWKTDPIRAAIDLVGGIRTINRVGGTGDLFRPPFGKLTVAGLIHGWLLGLRYAWWTIDSRDSWNRRPIDDVLAEIDDCGGGVVLMHDAGCAGGDATGPDHEQYVLDLTHRALDLAERRGLRVVTLSEAATVGR